MNDIVSAAERAMAYVRGLSFEQFAADARTVDYAIVVIGRHCSRRFGTSRESTRVERP